MIDEKKLIEDMLNNDGIDFRMDFNTDTEDSALESLREFADKFRQGMIELVQKQPKVGEWIPCSDRLPEEDIIAEYYDSVIVTLDNDRVAEGCYRNMDKEWWVDAPDGECYSENMTGHVVAWMPLPEPYKE